MRVNGVLVDVRIGMQAGGEDEMPGPERADILQYLQHLFFVHIENYSIRAARISESNFCARSRGPASKMTARETESKKPPLRASLPARTAARKSPFCAPTPGIRI